MSVKREVRRVKRDDIESGRIRHLSRSQEDRLKRFYERKLAEAGLMPFMNYARYKHYLREHIFEGWWESYEKARQAVERLVEDLASGKEIPEVDWMAEG